MIAALISLLRPLSRLCVDLSLGLKVPRNLQSKARLRQQTDRLSVLLHLIWGLGFRVQGLGFGGVYAVDTGRLNGTPKIGWPT